MLVSNSIDLNAPPYWHQ